ncbi:MAG: DNA-binding domain-containing protein [Emcibacter sp.]|nr:DNA-binding domain-containing protein [Emcibacter sp.]
MRKKVWVRGMATLFDIQEAFLSAILDSQNDVIADEILGHVVQERLNIYRNNTFITLRQALSQNFPVLCRLVGQQFFDHMAGEYIQKNPPTTPLLMTYGVKMPEFLADFEAVGSLPYLADVARLEHLWNMSFNGSDTAGFDLETLNRIEPDKFEDIIFKCLPNMQLMSSIYPVLDIWLANQAEEGASRNINLDKGPCHLAIFRKAQEVEIMALDLAGYSFFGLLGAGKTLGAAAEQMAGEYPNFNLQEALQNILQNNLIVDFEFAE